MNCGLEAVFLCGLCRLHLPSPFGGSAGFDTDTCHIFPQGVVTTLTLLGAVAGDGGARAGSRCEAGLPLCSVAITALSWVGSTPKLLE